MRLGAVLLVFVMSTTASAQQFATVTTNAPIYAAAQETPTPLRVAAVGSRLRVVSTEGDWVQVEYNDPQLGRRVGWVLGHYVSLSNQDLRPMDLSVPEAPPAPPALDQPIAVPTTMATSIPFPKSETSLGWSFLHVSGEFLDLNSAIGWNVSVAGNVSAVASYRMQLRATRSTSRGSRGGTHRERFNTVSDAVISVSSQPSRRRRQPSRNSRLLRLPDSMTFGNGAGGSRCAAVGAPMMATMVDIGNSGTAARSVGHGSTSAYTCPGGTPRAGSPGCTLPGPTTYWPWRFTSITTPSATVMLAGIGVCASAPVGKR